MLKIIYAAVHILLLVGVEAFDPNQPPQFEETVIFDAIVDLQAVDKHYQSQGIDFLGAVAYQSLPGLFGSVISGQKSPINEPINGNIAMFFPYGAVHQFVIYYTGLDVSLVMQFVGGGTYQQILPQTTPDTVNYHAPDSTVTLSLPQEVRSIFLSSAHAVYYEFKFTPGAFPIFQDPAVSGFRGQFFHFEAPDGWYAAISEPHMQFNWRLTEFTAKVAKTHQDYITGVAATFFDDDKNVLQKVLMEFEDVTKPSHGCPGGAMDPCLHRGNLKLAIGDTVIDRPGEYDLFSGAKLYAINSPLECSYLNGMLHAMDDAKSIVVDDSRRKLSVLTGLEAFSRTSDTSSEKCSKWLAEREEKGDLYSQYAYLTTVIISTPHVSLRVEFRENAKEEWYWLDYQYKTPTEDDQTEIWSGIHGETKQGTFDKNGVEIIKGRSVLSGQDADYRVDGAFGTEFAARIV